MRLYQVRPHRQNRRGISLAKNIFQSYEHFVLCVKQTIDITFEKNEENRVFFSNMFGNIVPLTTVGAAQVLPTNAVGNNDLVIIQDTTTATTQAELINQLQNHITENQQILIITDDQGQDQCRIAF